MPRYRKVAAVVRQTPCIAFLRPFLFIIEKPAVAEFEKFWGRHANIIQLSARSEAVSGWSGSKHRGTCPLQAPLFRKAWSFLPLRRLLLFLPVRWAARFQCQAQPRG